MGFAVAKASTNPHSFPCHNYTSEDEVESIVTAIIAPIVFNYQESSVRLSWACNRGEHCHNTSCVYAYALQKGREKPWSEAAPQIREKKMQRAG